VALGWTSKASLPGLTLYQGTESSATSQLTAFVVPPPGDLVVRFAMYRTYGYTDEQSGVAVVVAMIARYAIIFVMPLIGLTVVLLAGQGTWTELWWLLGLGAVVGGALWLLLRVVHSDAAAHRFGGWLSRVVTRVWHWVRRTPPTDLESSVVGFSRRMRDTVDHGMWPLVASNLTWGMANVLVMGLALRFSGLDSSTLSAAEVVLVSGAAMALNVIPIPGGFSITEAGLLALVDLTTAADQADFTAALLLYRVVTFLLPMPVGGAAFFAWRWRVRRTAAREEALAT
jgi:uncharacterized membrane protein YbhN (UPF0104 family)